jgi:uncharacterized protein
VAGLLVVLALIALVFYAFARAFRSRAQANLQRAGQDLPAELKAALRAAAKPGTRPGPAAAAAAAVAAMRAPVSAPAPRVAAAGLHFLLIYDVGPDFITRRAQYRDQHLALAWQAAAAGELLLAGALEEPTEQAFLLFRGSRDAARRFAESDPYVMHGLVRQWCVKQWHTVAGETAALPTRPGPASKNH